MTGTKPGENIRDTKGCACGEEISDRCPVCVGAELPAYWCEVCSCAVAQKRCPRCGLKARRIRDGRHY